MLDVLIVFDYSAGPQSGQKGSRQMETKDTTIIVTDTAKDLMRWKRKLEAMAKVGRDATEAERRQSRLVYAVLRPLNVLITEGIMTLAEQDTPAEAE